MDALPFDELMRRANLERAALTAQALGYPGLLAEVIDQWDPESVARAVTQLRKELSTVDSPEAQELIENLQSFMDNEE